MSRINWKRPFLERWSLACTQGRIDQVDGSFGSCENWGEILGDGKTQKECDFHGCL